MSVRLTKGSRNVPTATAIEREYFGNVGGAWFYRIGIWRVAVYFARPLVDFQHKRFIHARGDDFHKLNFT